MADLLTSTTFRSFKTDGTPNALGKVYTYAAGTLTPLSTYTTEEANVENANPVTLGADGSASIWLEPARAYRIIEKTAAGVTIRDRDNLLFSTTSYQAPGTITRSQSWTSTEGQTEFTFTSISYATGVGALSVTVDGLDVEVTELTTTSFRVPQALAAGMEVTAKVGQLVTGGIDAAQISNDGRALDDHLGDYFNVKDYGATGDGSTEDYSTVQDCIDACVAAGGGTVYFPAGQYVNRIGTWDCTGAVVILKGAGVRATRLQINHTAGPAVEFEYYFSGCEDMTIGGTPTRLAATSGSNHGILFTKNDALSPSLYGNFVRRVLLDSHGGHGVQAEGAALTVDESRVLNCGKHGIYVDYFGGVGATPAGFTEIHMTQIANCVGHGVCVGVTTLGYRVTLDNVDIYNCARASGVRQAAYAAWVNADNLVARNCAFAGWDDVGGAPLIGGLFVNGRSPYIHSNRFLDVAGAAVELGDSAHGYRIVANHITGGSSMATLTQGVIVHASCVGGYYEAGYSTWQTNLATASPQNSGNLASAYNIPLQGFRSNIGRSTLADDSVKSWTFRAESGAAWGIAALGFNSSTAESCLIAWRAGDASAYCTLLSTATNVNTTTGALAGTTGTDGKLTVSVSTSGTPTLYLENRRGSSVDVMPTFLSIGRGELGGVS